MSRRVGTEERSVPRSAPLTRAGVLAKRSPSLRGQLDLGVLLGRRLFALKNQVGSAESWSCGTQQPRRSGGVPRPLPSRWAVS